MTLDERALVHTTVLNLQTRQHPATDGKTKNNGTAEFKSLQSWFFMAIELGH